MTQRTPQPEQGPAWLADWLLTPPDWLRLLILGVGGVVALVVLFRLSRRDWRVSDSQQSLMLIVAGSALGVMTAVAVLRTYATLPFMIDAGAGFVLGEIGANIWSVDRVAATVIPDAWSVRQRYQAGWLAIFGIALAAPVVGITDPVVELARGYLLMLAGVMLLYNHQHYEVD